MISNSVISSIVILKSFSDKIFWLIICLFVFVMDSIFVVFILSKSWINWDNSPCNSELLILNGALTLFELSSCLLGDWKFSVIAFVFVITSFNWATTWYMVGRLSGSPSQHSKKHN